MRRLWGFHSLSLRVSSIVCLQNNPQATQELLRLIREKASEEHILRCTVGTLHETVTGNGLTKTSLIVVGNCLGDNYLRSLLYHPDFTTEFRKGAQ